MKRTGSSGCSQASVVSCASATSVAAPWPRWHTTQPQSRNAVRYRRMRAEGLRHGRVRADWVGRCPDGRWCSDPPRPCPESRSDRCRDDNRRAGVSCRDASARSAHTRACSASIRAASLLPEKSPARSEKARTATANASRRRRETCPISSAGMRPPRPHPGPAGSAEESSDQRQHHATVMNHVITHQETGRVGRYPPGAPRAQCE